MKKYFKCLICGYIHEDDEPPEECPICGAMASEFEKYEGSVTEKPVQTDDGVDDKKTAGIVIIGGGIAGLSAAEEIRKNSSEAEITIISGENELPYYRMSLTRYLAGEIGIKSLAIHPPEWYVQKNIKVLTGREVQEITRETKTVLLDDGTRLSYENLVLANGSVPFIPPTKGSGLYNVMTVRKLTDVQHILDNIQDIHNCVCIGGGILGLEAAGAIAKSGVKVTVVEVAEWLMPRQLNRKAAGIFKSFLQGIGMEIRDNMQVSEITGTERCEGVLLANGERLPADLVVITAGVKPHLGLAKQAGLEVDKGVKVNNRMQTSDTSIYAAGDVTEHNGVVYGLWNASQYQGKAAGMNIAGKETQFGGIPRSSFLKALDIDIFSIGEFIPVDASYHQYEKESEGSYYCLLLKDGKMAGGIVIGDKAVSMKIKKAVENGTGIPENEHYTVDSIISIL